MGKKSRREAIKTRNLKEIKRKVEQMRSGLGIPVDEKIKPLVIGLHFCGIKETTFSCEGHLDHGVPYPWVDIPRKYAERVAQVVAWQNRPKLPNGRQNENIWVIRPRPKTQLRLIPENKDLPLEELQKQAIEFGIFLQNLPDDRFPKDWFKENKKSKT